MSKSQILVERVRILADLFVAVPTASLNGICVAAPCPLPMPFRMPTTIWNEPLGQVHRHF